jgi:hypothetical protein
MKNRKEHLFASAVTGKGFCSYWDRVLVNLRHLYLLHGAGAGSKSLFLRLLGLALTDRGYRVAYFHRPEDHLALEGLVLRDLAAGIVDAEAPGLAGKEIPPKLTVTEVNLRSAGRSESLAPGDSSRAAALLHQAAAAWRQITEAGRGQQNGAISSQVAKLVDQALTKPLHLKHYFTGTVSADGPVDLTAHLTASCSSRYFFSGLPGSGREAMEQVLAKALERHYEVEVYHSYLDPDDLVSLIFPEIGVAVVDGTGCFRLEPLPGDIVLDLGGVRSAGQGNRERLWETEMMQLLTEAGRALAEDQPLELQLAVPATDEEINAFIARLLQERGAEEPVAGKERDQK